MALTKSIGKLSEVLSEEPGINLGYCKDHARSNEAFCEICKYMICPSCLMFGSHQGHKVLDPAKAAQVIRERITKTQQSGKLAPEYSERFLLDIRDAKIKLAKTQTAAKEQVQESFKNIINTLKRRKEEIEDAVYTHFTDEIETVDREEVQWIEKQNLGKKLLEFSNSPDDEMLLNNSFTIMSAIDVLNESARVKSANLINSVDLTSNIEGKEVGFAQVVRICDSIGKFGEIKNIQYRN